MATSGTYIFNPDLAEMVDEALERCRIDPAKITSRHILSARRSMRFMLADWATRDYHNFRIQRQSFALVQSQSVYIAGTDFDNEAPATNGQAILDILHVVLRRNGVDTPVVLMSRDELINIPDKDIEGRPDRVFIDKGRDGITLTFWTVPENSTDEIHYDAVLKFEDSDTAADNSDIPYYMYDAFAYGLSFRLAEKFSVPDLEAALYQKSENAFRSGSNAARERGDVRIVPSSSRRRRGRASSYR